jgi:tetratricopeptide (TPR) repeat protein
LQLFLAACVVAGTGLAIDRWRQPAVIRAEPSQLRSAFGPADYQTALAASDGAVTGARDHLALSPGEWLRMEGLARALASRYRLAGDLADLAEADALLERAVAAAPDPSGPTLTRASVLLMLHRLEQASAMLDRFDRQAIPAPVAERADALGLRGDIALQRGQIAAAERFYGEARALSDTPGMRLRAGLLLARTGRMDLARAAIDGAMLAPGQQPAALSEIALQRASLAYAAGDIADAGRWITAADRIFPGRWLTRSWLAQQKAVQGDRSGAIRDYAVLARETRRPEVIDALAHLLRLEGRGDESRDWARISAAAWAERMASDPLAFASHAAEHEITLGSPQKALALARSDATARPFGPALVLLARTQTLTGDPPGALATLAQAEGQGWRTSLLYLEKAAALELLGRGDEAMVARRRAQEYNPLALDPAMQAVWFGHE